MIAISAAATALRADVPYPFALMNLLLRNSFVIDYVSVQYVPSSVFFKKKRSIRSKEGAVPITSKESNIT